MSVQRFRIALEPFAYRHFQPDFAGTKITIPVSQFVSKINEYYETSAKAAELSGTTPWVDGYAWFCKHLFVPNFVGATVGVIPITESNEHLLKTAYEARTPQVSGQVCVELCRYWMRNLQY